MTLYDTVYCLVPVVVNWSLNFSSRLLSPKYFPHAPTNSTFVYIWRAASFYLIDWLTEPPAQWPSLRGQVYKVRALHIRTVDFNPTTVIYNSTVKLAVFQLVTVEEIWKVIAKVLPSGHQRVCINELENVTIANSTQRPPDAAPVPIHFNYDAHAKFEVAQPIRCRLIAFVLLIR